MSETGSNNDINTIVPSTPSWMTDQRQRRQNRRGYGRRYSGVGFGGISGSLSSSSSGIHSTALRSYQRRRETPSQTVPGVSPSTLLDFDDDEETLENRFLPISSAVRTRGGRPPRPQRSDGRSGGGEGGLDLLDEFELMSSKPKKTRPNNSMQRPPPFKFATPITATTTSLVDDFEFESEVSANSTEIGSLKQQQHHHSSMPGTPMTKMGVDGSRHNHLHKAMTSSFFSESATTSSTSIGENVHPNDSSGTLIVNNNFVNKGGARRSSRIGQLKANESKNSSHHFSGLSSSSSSSLLGPVEPTNNKLISKKRSATEPTNTATCCEVDQESKPIATRSATMASFSSGLFSKSTPASIGGNSVTAGRSSTSRSESFSSLAQQSSSSQSCWAVASSSSGSSSGFIRQSLEKQRSNSMACIQDSNHGFNARNTAPTTSTTSNNVLHTPSDSVSHRLASYHRSISCGNVLSDMKYTSDSSSLLAYSQEQQQHGGGGTTLSTPSAVSSASSSRKRRSTDVTSSPPLLNEFEMVGGGGSYNCEQRTRSRKGSPSSPNTLMHHDEVPLTTSSSTEPAVLPMSFSSPPPLLFMASTAATTAGAAAFGWNNASTTQVDKTLEDVRDKLNDVSMMSTRSDDDDSDDEEQSTNTSFSEDESNNAADDDDEVTPREMTDVEIFESKSSYEDFKWLTRSLQKCTQSSSQGKVASMGLNNGCVVALPPNWTFEHRATFSKWVAIAFGFRIGSVGGIGGSFLRCSDSEGKAVLDRLIRILNDYKNNRLELSTTTAKEGGKLNESNDSKPKARYVLEMLFYFIHLLHSRV